MFLTGSKAISTGFSITAHRIVIDECLNLTQLLEEIHKLPPRNIECIGANQHIALTPSLSLKRAVQLTFTTEPQITVPLTPSTGFGEIIDLDYQVVDWDNNSQKSLSSGIYEVYEPQTIRIPSAQAHPTPLVQSAAMASVAPPQTYLSSEATTPID